MKQFEQEQAAKKFVELWKDRGNEKSDAQKFWIQLLRDVLGVQDSEQYINFELPIQLNRTSFADGYIEATHTLIEMKGRNIDLNKEEKQSDGTFLTPYGQAKRYSDNLGYSKRARWIIVSNFKEIHIYDMDKPHQEPQILKLENLPKDYYMLNILVDSEDENIKREEDLSIDAGKIVGKIYKELFDEYKKREADEEKFAKSINALCVRLVFCLYAEDSGLFGKHLMFHDYLKKYPASELRTALIKLFKILDTPIDKRDPFENEELLAFPYVNGGLFADEDILIPQFTEKIKDVLLDDASAGFNWSEISPTIFGSVFESTLNPETRRAGGMHYTSVKNIHKVIDPLFLNELTYELDKICEIHTIKDKKEELEEYQEKLSNLKFLDPACGSGNFLTETYISLRKLENRIIEEYYQGQVQMAPVNNDIIKVSINQFYGIEINDFAVTVAKTALWIAEAQMYKKTREIVMINDDFLPLKSYANIYKTNALRIDWNEVVPKEELNYIMGNPPFIGKGGMRNTVVVEDLKNLKIDESLDYVAAWYFIASKYIQNTNIKCAFVSTNSITQGEQVYPLWKNLMLDYNIIINFAYRTFIWDSEANQKAQVHCVIIGFSVINNDDKIIYISENRSIKAKNINGYLIDAPNVFIDKRYKPLCNVNEVISGNRPDDNGNYILNQEEMEQFIKNNPEMKSYIKKFIGSREFINNIPRYCIWLLDVDPQVYINNKDIMERIKKVVEFRKNAKGESLKKLADEPLKWKAIKKNKSDYILLPRVSSQNREYIPIGFIDKDVIGNDSIQMLPNATLYDFGILTSNVHNAWTRIIAGRLKSDYRYSNTLVYNNFPWPNPTQKQKEKIEGTAQAILNARKKYSNSSLADMYGEEKMKLFPDLYKAHKNNDAAVMNAYGFKWREMSEDDCVAELMKMYQELVNKGKE